MNGATLLAALLILGSLLALVRAGALSVRRPRPIEGGRRTEVGGARASRAGRPGQSARPSDAQRGPRCRAEQE